MQFRSEAINGGFPRGWHSEARIPHAPVYVGDSVLPHVNRIYVGEAVVYVGKVVYVGECVLRGQADLRT